MPRANHFLSIFLTITFLTASLLSAPVLARNPLQNIKDYDKEVFDPAIQSQDVNLQSTVYEVVLSIIAALNRSGLCFQEVDPSGGGTGPCVTAPTQTLTNGITPQYVASGIIPELTQISSSLVTNPAISSTQYLASLDHKLNLGIQPAYAQGIGYSSLSSLVTVWEGFRNIAYLFCTAGFLILAFMVMLRIKAGQGVINAQAAITKFIFVVLAITFSYAIAGFIIDLIYVFSGLIVALFISSNLYSGTLHQLQTQVFGGSLVQTMTTLIAYQGSAGTTVSKITEDIFKNLYSGTGAGVLGGIFSWSVGSIATLIFSIMIIWSLIRLFIQLVLAYIQIILYTVLSPLIILPDILPGGNAFKSWLRNIFAHAMIFPATVFSIILGLALVENTSNGAGTSALGSANLVLPFLRLNTGTIGSLIGFAFILIVPKINDMVKNFFKVSSFQYTSELIGNAQRSAAFLGAAAQVPFKGIRDRATKDVAAYEKYEQEKATASYARPGARPVATWKRILSRK